jgi:hypothetical protein
MRNGIKVSCKYKRRLHALCRNTEDLQIQDYENAYYAILRKVTRDAKKLAMLQLAYSYTKIL